MYILSIANQKGGVGKTTTAGAIAQGLTAAGYKVLSIDADPQENLSDLLQASHGASLYDVIHRRTEIRKAIQHTTSSGDLVRGDTRLTEKGLLSGKGEAYTIKHLLQPLARLYQVCIIDAPPSLGALTAAALIASDGVLVPVKADKFSLQGLQEIYTTIQEARRVANPQLELLGVIVCQYARTNLNRDMLDAIQRQAEIYETRVIMPPIRRTVSAESWQFTGAIFDGSTAAEDYAEIVRQLPSLLKL